LLDVGLALPPSGGLSSPKVAPERLCAHQVSHKLKRGQRLRPCRVLVIICRLCNLSLSNLEFRCSPPFPLSQITVARCPLSPCQPRERRRSHCAPLFRAGIQPLLTPRPLSTARPLSEPSLHPAAAPISRDHFDANATRIAPLILLIEPSKNRPTWVGQNVTPRMRT
jgi:hypothetical protein